MTLRTTIKPVNYDIINGRIEILIGGMRYKWIDRDDYRYLRYLAKSWTSGLRFVKERKPRYYQTTMLFIEDNVVRHIDYCGQGECSWIKSILN